MQPEFSRPIAVSSLPPKGRHFREQASARERDQLSNRLGLIGLKEMGFDVQLTPNARGTAVEAAGQFKAVVTQACSVTLAPLDTTIDVTFQLRFEDIGETDEEPHVDVDLDTDDPPEPIINGTFDNGESITQLIALEIDPFPRTPGLPFEDKAARPHGSGGQDSEADAKNPFAVLESLKDKLK